MNERSFYLAFSSFSGIGPIKFKKLLAQFGSAEKAWKASGPVLEFVLKPALAAKFLKFRDEFDILDYEKELIKKKISYLCLFEESYPKRLKSIKNPPIILYSKGKINFNSDPSAGSGQRQKFLAIVGTRKITSYGRSVTDMFAGKLGEAGIVIVSGLAIGVDAAAHTACLESRGTTVAVLGNGVDICFPRENQKIYDRILDGGGMIISEFPPGEPPSVGSFPSRNRIVAGICDGVLVAEGASDSGSLITANFGLEFGRKVFAVPGPITSNLSAAPLKLIEKGAKLIVSPEDVIRELGIKHSELPNNKKKFDNLSKEEKKIIELIENEPLSFDEIVRRVKFDPSKTATILSMMEIKGIIKQSGGSYSIIV